MSINQSKWQTFRRLWSVVLLAITVSLTIPFAPLVISVAEAKPARKAREPARTSRIVREPARTERFVKREGMNVKRESPRNQRRELRSGYFREKPSATRLNYMGTRNAQGKQTRVREPSRREMPVRMFLDNGRPRIAKNANKRELRWAQQEFRRQGLLNSNNTLTRKGIITSNPVHLSGGKIRNRAVVAELTKDGSKIRHWGKYRTGKIMHPSTKKPIEIHFYMNRKTGKINYTADYRFVDQSARAKRKNAEKSKAAKLTYLMGDVAVRPLASVDHRVLLKRPFKQPTKGIILEHFALKAGDIQNGVTFPSSWLSVT